jgi:Uma2 family endonuclease
MTRSADRTTRPPEPDPYRYGWRFLKKVQHDGRTDLVQVPLTLEDVLHPQEGDVIPETDIHEQERGDLKRIFGTRLSREEGGLVLSDCLIEWGVPGVRNHSPDVSAFTGLRVPFDPRMGTFHLALSGGRCLFLIELVSPDTRSNDVVEKVREYHEVRVPLYIIVDQEREDGPRRLLGYRYTRPGYRQVRLDRQGRLLLKPLGLYLAVEENRVVCYDAATGERFGDYGQERQAHLVERQARLAAEDRIRELEAELRRLRGETP